MTGIRIVLAGFLVALVAGCSGGSSSSTPSTPSPTPAPAPAPAAVTINIPSGARTLGTASYVPNPATVSQGTVVTWSNSDTSTHDIVSDTGVFDSGRVAQNGTFNFTFTGKGSFPYHCSIHPTMTGTIVVQ